MFPPAAVANDRKLCGFQEQFYYPPALEARSLMRSHQPGTSRAVFLLEAPAERLFLCLFQFPEAACAAWLAASPSILKASSISSSVSDSASINALLFCLLGQLSLCPPLMMTFVVIVGPPRESRKISPFQVP